MPRKLTERTVKKNNASEGPYQPKVERDNKRMKRFELSTLSLARRCSTTELHPQRGGQSSHHSIVHERGAKGQTGDSGSRTASSPGIWLKACLAGGQRLEADAGDGY